MTAPHPIPARPGGEVAPPGATSAAAPVSAASREGYERRERLDGTGAVPLVVTVTAVVVTRGRTPFLDATLDALARQDRGADEVVVVDVGAAESTAHPGLRLGGARFVAASGVRSLGEAVDRACEVVGVPETGWLWILHDDSAPEPDALVRLLRAVEHSSAVAVAGCKQRRWPVAPDGTPRAEASMLVEVGSTVSPLGRRMTGIDDTEIDQGQHDAREDVLAVGLAGALVRAHVWAELGGTDPELGPFGDGLDLCRRARLAGHRVVVVPDAVVRHAQASLLGLRGRPDAGPDLEASRYARRRSQLYLRLVDAPLPLLPFVWLATLLWAPFAAMYRLALKRPAHARDEILAALVTALRVVPLYRARRRAARSRRLPRRVLAPLLGTWRQVLGERRDARLARAEAQRARWAPTELERADLRRLGRTRRAVLAAVAVAVVALDVALFGPWQGVLADGGRVVGGGLLPAPGTVGDVWEAATSGWVRDGLGVRAPADPLLAPLTAFAGLAGGGLQTAVNALVVVALPLAALGGWFAAGALTRAVVVRAVAALAWAAAPGFLASLGSGRLGAVVVHLVLPWLLVALLRVVGAHARDVVPSAPARRRGSLGAAGAAGLLLAVAVCAAPVLLPVAVVLIGVAALVVRRSWRSLLLVLLPAVVVPLPFWGEVLSTWSSGGWRLLVAEPGAPVVAQDAPTGVELLLGLPGDTAWFERWLGSDGALGRAAVVGPALLGGAVLVLAAVALVRRRAVRGVRLAWLAAAAGLTTAVVAVSTAVASGTAEDGTAAGVTGGPGVGLSVLLLALGAAAICALPSTGRAPASAPVVRAERTGMRRAATAGGVAVAVVALALPAAQLGSWALGSTDGGAVGDLHAAEDPVVPAVGTQMQAPPRAARVLQLDRVQPGGDDAPAAAAVVDYALLHADGTRLEDSSTVVRARAAGLLAGGDRGDTALLDRVVAEVATGRSTDVADRLAALGIGAVQVPAGGDPELATTLDLVPGLARVTEEDVLVWRVTTDGPAPGWATVLTAAGAAADGTPSPFFAPTDAVRTVPSDGTRAGGRLAAGGEDRTLRLAESADTGWHATLDGRRLPAVDAGGTQAFAVGPDAGRVSVAYEAPHRTAWLTLAGAVLLVHVLLALPVGRRRGR
ncbi:glycosyltransferase family 2 protein [Isoptericola sp. 4D.3]|uniref:Glycosyltransferase family 2 protein n=1 Tax=Isoptericola peretonis TaxID=2918523 RepID=A0ABT0J654_9MICO|nr:glycosyltransferase family 2 protein [Isoptericola sp. 4D.3]